LQERRNRTAFAVAASAVCVLLLLPLGCRPSATSTRRQLAPGQIAPALHALAATEPPSRSAECLLAKFSPRPADVGQMVARLYAQPVYRTWFESIRFARTDAARRYGLMKAERVQIGRHDVVDLPAEPDWREDPLSDRNWKSLYHCLRWLLPAIWIADQEGDSEAVAFATRYVTSYLRTNRINGWRYPWGDQRTAERAKVFVTFLEVLRRRRLLDDELAVLLIGSLWEYGELLASERFYSFDTNHGLFQNEALLDIALAVPGFARSAAWRNLALARMDDQLTRNVSSDGIHQEGATGYHSFTLKHFQDYASFLADHRLPISAAMASRLLGMIHFQLVICRPDGTYPMIGDSEHEPAPFGEMALLLDALRRSTALQADPQLARRAVQCRQMLAFVRSRGGSGRWPAGDSFAFRRDGYFVLKTPTGRDRTRAGMLFLTAAPFSPVHGHRDALSICFSARGKDFLVDSGKFTYAADRRRGFFRSTVAHSTVLINEKDHADPRPKVIDCQLGREFDYVEAEHYGYEAATVNRAVLYGREGWALVLDEVRASKPVSCRQLWQLHPDAEVTVGTGETLVSMGQDVLHVVPVPGSMKAETVRGRREPMGGWVSFTYGELKPRTTLSFTAGGQQVALLTLLVPDAAKARPVAVKVVERKFGQLCALRFAWRNRQVAVRIDKRTVPRRIRVDISPWSM
jgi:hypothetical protein